MMNDFWLYIKLGLEHVLDLSAYDHILFLTALAVPFTFRQWQKVVLLASIFTIAHCTSLALSAYDLVRPNVAWIEFLIPVTIALTALFNGLRALLQKTDLGFGFLGLATATFGLVHGFGFSNYFNMLMAEEANKLVPLLGFALGIELSQVIIVLVVLLATTLLISGLRIKQHFMVGLASLLIFLGTIPMLIETFPK